MTPNELHTARAALELRIQAELLAFQEMTGFTPQRVAVSLMNTTRMADDTNRWVINGVNVEVKF